VRKYIQLIRWIGWFYSVLLRRRGRPNYSLELVKSNFEEFLAKYRSTESTYIDAVRTAEKLVSFLKNTTNIDLIRRGQKEGDGGYFVSSLDTPNKVISFGVGSNISFDLDFDENTSVFMFDHTVSKPDNLPKNVFFYNYGIAQKTGGEFITINEAFALAKIVQQDKVLLKIDIEGSEYDINLAELNPVNLNQIVIELHNINKILITDFRNKFDKLLHYFMENFICTYATGNNFTGISAYEKFVIPNTLEITMLNKNINRINVSNARPTSKNDLRRPILYPFYEST
jgi:hypothetical protein